MDEKWISVMDDLPEGHKRVIVRYRNKRRHKDSETIGYYNIHKHCWCSDYGHPFKSEVIAWRQIN